MQLPLGLFGVALGTVTLPLLSRLVVAKRFDAFRSELAHGMRLALLLTVPSTIGLMMLAEPIISTLYQHGRFDAGQAAQAAGALRFYAIGLGSYAALKVLVNAFYALDHRKTPMVVSFVAVALNLLFNWVFTFRLGWGASGAGLLLRGLVATCNFLVLHLLMQPQAGAARIAAHAADAGKGGIGSRWRCLVSVSPSHWLLEMHREIQSFFTKLAALLGTVVLGAAAFVACGLLMRIEELTELLDALRRVAQNVSADVTDRPGLRADHPLRSWPNRS